MRLEDVPREWLAAIAAALAVVVLWSALRRWWRRARMRARFERGAEGEREAAALLTAAGFAIEGAEVVHRYPVFVDGDPVTIELRADYLVRRGGARFVAEVKTGRAAPRIETATTRRQLLEYQHAFDVEGVLLVDADAGAIHLVAFEPPSGRSSTGWLGLALSLALVLAAALVGRYF